MSAAVAAAACINNNTDANHSISCPARMADGRAYTDYRPRCMTQYVMNNKAMSSFEQRQYLIRNADNIIHHNVAAAYTANACGPCVEPYDVGTMLPEHTYQS